MTNTSLLVILIVAVVLVPPSAGVPACAVFIVNTGCRIPDGMVVDRSWSGDQESGRLEPVVLTAQDIVETATVPERDWRLMDGARRWAQWRQIG